MLDDVYNARILELAGNIPRLGRLAAPDASATAHSRLCGSTVTVDLKVEGDRIVDFALSNLVNSSIFSIYVLVQFKSQSLNEHIERGWHFGGALRGRDYFITLVPAQMWSG